MEKWRPGGYGVASRPESAQGKRTRHQGLDVRAHQGLRDAIAGFVHVGDSLHVGLEVGACRIKELTDSVAERNVNRLVEQ